jgi:3-hydroxyisobutyrate dehydrogenase
MVGVGAMGQALLSRLKLTAVPVTAYDVYPASLEAARALGAIIALSAEAVAATSTLIDVVVRTDQDVLDCMLAENGILEGAQAGSLVILHSTINPQTTRKVADEAGRRRVAVIDACMVGQPHVVSEGNVSFLVGGPDDLVARARPHLLKMGRQVLHMGPLGAGNAAKIIKNLVTGSETLIVHEAIRIGQAAGIPYPMALEMMQKVETGGGSLARWQERFDPSGKDPTPRASTNLFDKDIPLAGDLARQYGVNVPITEQLVAACRRLLEPKE